MCISLFKKKNEKKFLILQQRALRFMYFIKKNEHTILLCNGIPSSLTSKEIIQTQN